MVPPRLLIITPTLGVCAHLEESLAAVAKCGLNVLHILSVPAARVEDLQQRFPGVRVVADAGRAGAIYGALNKGLEAAAGEEWEWFTYINDDDLLGPAFAAVYREHTARPDPEPVTYGDVLLINEASEILSLITVERTPACIPAILQNGISPMNQQGMLFHRRVVDGLREFQTKYTLCADLDFWLRAYASGASFRYYARKVGAFRIREGQLSGDTSVTRREQAEIVRLNLPAPRSAWILKLIRLRYRLNNLPRYFRRWRSVGWKTSEQVLGGTT